MCYASMRSWFHLKTMSSLDENDRLTRLTTKTITKCDFHSFRWYFILNFFIWTFFSTRVRWRIFKISRRCFDEQSKCIDHRQDQQFPFPFNSFFYFTRVQHCLRSSMRCNKMIMKVNPMKINQFYFYSVHSFCLLFSHYSIICWFDTRSQIVG